MLAGSGLALVAAVAIIALAVALVWRNGATGGPSLPPSSGSGAPFAAGGFPATGGSLDPGTRFYVPPIDPAARRQVDELRARGGSGSRDAALLEAVVSTPTAVWLTGGSEGEVRARVTDALRRAAAEHAVPVFVTYDVPGRDCSSYSAGGAATGDDYRAWIGALADALGTTEAIMLVEPDGLALLPADCGQPDPFDRVALIADAGRTLARDPNAHVYLDAGHSRWHATGDIAARLVRAGVDKVDGFFENTSNFQPTAESVVWGRWVSMCIWYGTRGPADARGQFGRCASQYSPASVDDPGTWARSEAWYVSNMGSVAPSQLSHMVIDTSRNGQGRWVPPAGTSTADAQEWCNPPGRGVGPRPTAATGDALVDAFLWIKVPGESDGACTRGSSGTADPIRGGVDPPAGAWFPDFALELARNANPALEPAATGATGAAGAAASAAP